MKKRMYNPNKDGIKIRNINLLMVILCTFLCAGVFISVFQLKSKYKSIIKNMEEYAVCTKAVDDFRNTSDYLTNQVRFFLIQQDMSYAENYFKEYSQDKNREKAVELLCSFHQNDPIQVNMNLAFEESQSLAQTEMYTIALIYTALNIPPKMFPAQIQDLKLDPKDLLLDSEKLLEKAEILLFGIGYQSSKDKINKYTTQVLDSVFTEYSALAARADISSSPG